MPLYDLTCPCGHEQLNCYLRVGERPPCPTCGEPTETLWWTVAPNVVPDKIPRGVEIRHDLCNGDGSPRRYYSKSEMAREAARRGLRNHVEHVPQRGSDKSPHTTRRV